MHFRFTNRHITTLKDFELVRRTLLDVELAVAQYFIGITDTRCQDILDLNAKEQVSLILGIHRNYESIMRA